VVRIVSLLLILASGGKYEICEVVDKLLVVSIEKSSTTLLCAVWVVSGVMYGMYYSLVMMIFLITDNSRPLCRLHP
jgi:hypothetical protein